MLKTVLDTQRFENKPITLGLPINKPALRISSKKINTISLLHKEFYLTQINFEV